MKFLVRYYLILIIPAVLCFSCKKDLLDINTNPNSPTTALVTPDLVLSTALNATAAQMNTPTADSRFVFAGIWMGHISYSGNYAIATENISYNITSNFASAAFANIYDNLNDYDFVEKKGIALESPFYEAVGKLMKAYNFQVLVDLYNDVPYAEALQGTTASKPKYQSGKAIYDDLAKKIDTSITLLNKSVSGSISGDIMFGGDKAKWLKFANTVKLRLLIRQSEKTDRQAYITTETAKFGTATFLDADAAVNPGYLNSAGKTNPFWGANVNTNGTYTQDLYRAGQYAISFYKANNDPRLAKLYTPAATGGDYQGNYFGDQGLTNSKTSGFGPGVLKSFTQPAILMLAAESYFVRAEATVRGWIAGDAAALYKKGVEASFIYLGLTAAQAQTYYGQANNKQVNWESTTNTQEKIALIIRQKWAALALTNELEVYNDYRRLKQPADVPLSLSPFSTGKLPNRLLYPQREYDVNATNVQAVGTVTPTDKVWWIP